MPARWADTRSLIAQLSLILCVLAYGLLLSSPTFANNEPVATILNADGDIRIETGSAQARPAAANTLLYAENVSNQTWDNKSPDERSDYSKKWPNATSKP